jgi:hypothetical protein
VPAYRYLFLDYHRSRSRRGVRTGGRARCRSPRSGFASIACDRPSRNLS